MLKDNNLIRKTIIALLCKLDFSLEWVAATNTFIKSRETKQLSNIDLVGRFIVSNLLTELKIRSKSTKNAGIETIGMKELITELEATKKSNAVVSHVFQNAKYHGVIYLDAEHTKVFGAILTKANIKNTIIFLLDQKNNISECAKKTTAFLKSVDTILVKDKSKNYIVSILLEELSKEQDLNKPDNRELVEKLVTMGKGKKVLSYVFKSNIHFATIYLNESFTKVIGTVFRSDDICMY